MAWVRTGPDMQSARIPSVSMFQLWSLSSMRSKPTPDVSLQWRCVHTEA